MKIKSFLRGITGNNSEKGNPKSRNTSDLEIINGYKLSKDTGLVLELMERYSGQIVAFGLKSFRNPEDVKDFTTDVFIKLSADLLKSDVSNFNSWLHVFMKNMLYDRLRKQKVRNNYRENLVIEKVGNPEEKMIFAIDREHIEKGLSALNEKEQVCIRMIYLEEKSYKEIMDKTGWSFNQIRGIRDRASVKLKKILPKEFKPGKR